MAEPITMHSLACLSLGPSHAIGESLPRFLTI